MVTIHLGRHHNVDGDEKEFRIMLLIKLTYLQGELEVVCHGLPLSLQQAQTMLLQDAHHLDQYFVYSHLTRTGCKVVRHQPHLIFTSMGQNIDCIYIISCILRSNIKYGNMTADISLSYTVIFLIIVNYV